MAFQSRNMRLCYCFFFLFLLNTIQLHSQKELITIGNGGRAELPFSYVNNFLIVDVTFNGYLPLKFIFDTGAENTILTQREITDILKIDYQRKITLFGADLTTELHAYVAPRIDLTLGEDLIIAEQSILVLEEDYFNFEQLTGVQINGIIGADILRRFVIQIDYKRRKIIFQDPSVFKAPRSNNYVKLESEFSRFKPYLFLPTSLNANQPLTLKYLLDSGASLALLIYASQDSIITLPDNLISSNIGFGLGGSLKGFIGRTDSLQLGNYELKNVVTNFQDLSNDSIIHNSFLNNRNGLLGNVVLKRFNLIIDYIREDIYIRPNRDFKKKFLYDRSGMNFVASGQNLNKFVVISVVKNSPAYLAGILPGDEIKAINGIPTALKTLESVIRKFQKKSGKKMKILIKRGEEKLTMRFELRDLI